MSIKEILSQALRIPISRIPDDASRGKLRGWDSLGHVTLVSAIEEQFSIVFEHAEILQMTSIADITTVLLRRGIELGTVSL